MILSNGLDARRRGQGELDPIDVIRLLLVKRREGDSALGQSMAVHEEELAEVAVRR